MNDSGKPPTVLALLQGDATKDQRAEMVRKLEANWATEVAVFAVFARVKKMNFDAYVAAGFTPDQALEMVR